MSTIQRTNKRRFIYYRKKKKNFRAKKYFLIEEYISRATDTTPEWRSTFWLIRKNGSTCGRKRLENDSEYNVFDAQNLQCQSMLHTCISAHFFLRFPLSTCYGDGGRRQYSETFVSYTEKRAVSRFTLRARAVLARVVIISTQKNRRSRNKTSEGSRRH